MYNKIVKKINLYYNEKNTLIVAFLLNFIIFLVELYYGYVENSAALLGDSAHNIGDAAILGSSISIISSSHKVKGRLAIIKCSIWAGFGLLALYQVFISYSYGIIPSAAIIGWIGFSALLMNIFVTLLLGKFKDNDVNIKSAFICCRNDAIGNVLVILAGFLVYKLQSNWPDLVAGLIISTIILYSSISLGIESYKVAKTGEYNV